MIKVKLKSDDSGDDYLIPNELCAGFDIDQEEIDNLDQYSDTYFKACDAFNKRYSQYLIGGDVNNIQLYIESPIKP